MSGRRVRKASRPDSPSGMAVTAKPSRSRASWVASRMTSSSSTNRTWVCSAIRCSQFPAGAGVSPSPTALLYSLRVLVTKAKWLPLQLYVITSSLEGYDTGSPFS